MDYANPDVAATAGSDYTATSGTVSFAAGQTSATISIPITNDTLFELDENFLVTLSPAVGVDLVSPSSMQVTILSDPLDSPPGC